MDLGKIDIHEFKSHFVDHVNKVGIRLRRDH